jgi:D-alanyl-D-alanine carboxypeptidase
MNIRAGELGLKTLSFKNTTGLDISVSEPGAVGSARETSHLLEHILMEYPEVLEPTKRGEARVFNEDGSYYDVTNTNDALYAIPNLLASKTGYTDLAGGNLTVAFDAGFDRPIIVTVLGSTRDERFSDVLRLITAIRDHSDSL